MDIKETLSKFDEAQAEQEESVKALEDEKEEVKDAPEAEETPEKEEPKAEDVEEKEEEKEDDKDADEAEDVEETPETETDEVAKSDEDTEVETDEEPEKEEPEEDTEEDKEDEETEKSVEEEDKEEEEEEALVKVDLSELSKVFNSVAKSYQSLIEHNKALIKSVNGLKDKVVSFETSAHDKVEEADKEKEELSKSLITDETVEEPKAKAEGYASKSVTPTSEDVEDEVSKSVEEKKTHLFDGTDEEAKKAFKGKLETDARAGNISRGTASAYRTQYLRAIQGAATKSDLENLYSYVYE